MMIFMRGNLSVRISLNRMPFSFRCRKFLHGLNGALVRMNYRYADCVTSLGEFNRKWQVRIGADPQKILFVPNGVDADVFQPRPEKRPERVTVVTLARIYPLKGIDTLLRVHPPRDVVGLLGSELEKDVLERVVLGARRE